MDAATALAHLESTSRDWLLCYEDASEDMIKCEICAKKTHLKFLSLDKDTANSIVKYFCKTCPEEKGVSTE